MSAGQVVRCTVRYVVVVWSAVAVEVQVDPIVRWNRARKLGTWVNPVKEPQKKKEKTQCKMIP